MNLYPMKDDLDIWIAKFSEEHPTIDDTIIGEMITCSTMHKIRKKAHGQINDYLMSDDVKTKVPDLYNIYLHTVRVQRPQY
jgi:hypothetical protein